MYFIIKKSIYICIFLLIIKIKTYKYFKLNQKRKEKKK